MSSYPIRQEDLPPSYEESTGIPSSNCRVMPISEEPPLVYVAASSVMNIPADVSRPPPAPARRRSKRRKVKFNGGSAFFIMIIVIIVIIIVVNVV